MQYTVVRPPVGEAGWRLAGCAQAVGEIINQLTPVVEQLTQGNCAAELTEYQQAFMTSGLQQLKALQQACKSWGDTFDAIYQVYYTAHCQALQKALDAQRST